MLLTRIYYRFRQLGRSLVARPLTELETGYIARRLNPIQLEMFQKLPIYEQRHALNVCRTLARSGYGHDRELLQAALLHDLGKHDPATGKTIPVWLKVVNVALGHERVAMLARPDRPDHWRYLFWLQTDHEQRGAELVEKAGSSPRVVRLVRHYQATTQLDEMALAWADDLN